MYHTHTYLQYYQDTSLLGQPKIYTQVLLKKTKTTMIDLQQSTILHASTLYAFYCKKIIDPVGYGYCLCS